MSQPREAAAKARQGSRARADRLREADELLKLLGRPGWDHRRYRELVGPKAFRQATIAAARRAVAQSVSDADIIELLQRQWGLAESTSAQRLRDAYGGLSLPSQSKATLLARYDALYQRCLRDGSAKALRVAKDILFDQACILGIAQRGGNVAVQVNAGGVGKGPKTEQLDEIVGSLYGLPPASQRVPIIDVSGSNGNGRALPAKGNGSSNGNGA